MRHWYRRGALAWLLWPASLVFAFLAFWRRALYKLRILKSVHPGIAVVVVGNLTVGGSGKTP
ncbi:MAG: tetraacyldisaccharide 4-kinase, partial [Betaproteobacteria bacterium]|nr:tetraacyldisaccharide 4-kinase [Betaproteobacteria bacterium]